jgi:ABC-2 type transport system permease protein
MIAFTTLYKREVRRFLRVMGQTVVTPIINSSLYLLIFGVSLGASIELKSGITYLAFLIPGLIMMSVLNNAFQNTSSSIVNSKFHGELQDLRVMPLSTQTIVWAFALGGLTRGLMVGLITYIVGAVFYFIQYQEILAVHHPIYLLLFLAIGGISFSFLGISVSFWAKNFDQLSAIGSFVLLPLMYLGGVFYSIELLHPFWQAITKVNPMLYFINGVRYGLVGVSDVDVNLSLVISAISLVVLFALANRSVKRGTYSRW